MLRVVVEILASMWKRSLYTADSICTPSLCFRSTGSWRGANVNSVMIVARCSTIYTVETKINTHSALLLWQAVLLHNRYLEISRINISNYWLFSKTACHLLLTSVKYWPIDITTNWHRQPYQAHAQHVRMHIDWFIIFSVNSTHAWTIIVMTRRCIIKGHQRNVSRCNAMDPILYASKKLECFILEAIDASVIPPQGPYIETRVSTDSITLTAEFHPVIRTHRTIVNYTRWSAG